MSHITDFIGGFFAKTTAPSNTMNELGHTATTGDAYLDNRTSNIKADGSSGGALMVYTNSGWFGALLTTSSSTSTTTTTTTTTTTSSSTSTS